MGVEGAVTPTTGHRCGERLRRVPGEGWRFDSRPSRWSDLQPSAQATSARPTENTLCFTGRQHAGENIADVLKQRAKDLSPVIQMCDALSRNVPKLPSGVEILVANCLAHGRRQFVEVVQNFPEERRHVLEMLGVVYRCDAEARAGGLTAKGAVAVSSGAQRSGDGENCTVGWRRSSPNGRRSPTPVWATPSRAGSGRSGTHRGRARAISCNSASWLFPRMSVNQPARHRVANMPTRAPTSAPSAE